MGRSAPIDPVMAARLAAEAAAAAQAAASAAAAADAAAQAGGVDVARAIAADTTMGGVRTANLAGLTGLADDGSVVEQTSGRTAAEVTGATLGGQVDGSALGGIFDRDAMIADATDQAPASDGILPDMDLAGLGGAANIGRGALGDVEAAFALDGGASDRPAMGKDMLMDKNLSNALASTPFYNDAGTPDGGSDAGSDAGGPVYQWTGSLGHPGWTSPDGEVVDKLPAGAVDSRTLKGQETTATAKTHLDDVEGGAIHETDGDPWYVKVWNAVTGGGSDAGTDAGTDGGTDGGTPAPSPVYQTEDQAGFTRPKGWIDPEAILGGRSIGGAITGSRGGDPDGDDGDTNPGPQGGSTTVNPGTEGVAPAEKGSVDLSGAVAYSGVKDPPKPVDGPAVLDPAKLEAAPEGAEPGAVDPGDPNASIAASTAYAQSEPVAMDDVFGDQGGHARGLGQGHGASRDEHGRNGSDGDSTDRMDDAS